MLVFGALAEVPLAELPLLPVPGAPVTGGGGKRRKRPVRPLAEIQAEARATPQVVEEAAAAAPAPKPGPTLPALPWQSPQVLPPTPQPAKVLPFQRAPAHGRARIREENDAVEASVGAIAGLHAHLNEEHDRLAETGLHIDPLYLHGAFNEDHDRAASHATTARVDQDEEDAIALLLDGID